MPTARPLSTTSSLAATVARFAPPIGFIVPIYLMVQRSGMLDTQIALIIVYTSMNLSLVIWVLRGFFSGLPAGLERAARIDGATVLQTFRLVVLPISLPPLFAAAIFAFGPTRMGMMMRAAAASAAPRSEVSSHG